jgi:two-component system cell cycle sensor histidine kinase/response regulator CckA
MVNMPECIKHVPVQDLESASAVQKRIGSEITQRNLTMQALAFSSEVLLAEGGWLKSLTGVLKCLGAAAGADRAHVSKIYADAGGRLFSSRILEWCAAGISSQIGNLKLNNADLEGSDLGRRGKLLKEGNIVYGNISDFSEAYGTVLEEQDIRSTAEIPIFEGNLLWGVVGVDSCTRDREWKLQDLDLLRVFEGIIGSVLRHKKVEDDLKISRERFDQVAEVTREMIWEVNAEGLYTYVSGLSKSILGYEPWQLIGEKYFYDRHPEIEKEEFKKSVFDAFERKAVIRELLNPSVSRDGRIVWLSTNGVPVLDPSGKLLGYRGSDIDITDRFKAEQEKKVLEEQLCQTQRMDSIGRLAGGVAHDFNNCLQVILGFSELILIDADRASPEYSNLLEVRRAAKQAAEITNQLLIFNRKQVVALQILNINDIAVQQQKMLKRLIGENIIFELNLEKDLPNIYADPGNIQQVIMNLSVNARDAMPEGGTLTIRTSSAVFSEKDSVAGSNVREGKFACISVSDSGTGMTKEVISHIFEPFFTTKGIGNGTGLGLSVVHGIVEQHNGWIHVYSELDKGSEFKIYFPAADSEKTVEIVETENKEIWHKGSGESLLVVEDDPAVRNIACNVLRQYGYEVWEASGCKEARIMFGLDVSKFKIVISDVVLPDGNGVELVGELLKTQPGLKVLLTSGYTDEKSRWKEINGMGCRFLYKPYPLKELLRIVHEILKAAQPGK